MGHRPWSLNARLLLAASLALVAFLGATAAALDVAIRESALAAVRDRLQGQLYTLLAAADVEADGRLLVPEAVPEPRFARPGSGLYAQINGDDFQWQTRSLLGFGGELPQEQLAPGERHFEGPREIDGERLFLLALGVAWELEDGSERRFTFRTAEATEAYQTQIRRFRRALWGWLAAVAVVLLAVQGVVLRWGLRPLRGIEQELGRVEAGDQARLANRYPSELEGLAGRINAFIRSERTRLERFRNSLSDLAHSLKTPLAVMRSSIDEARTEERFDQAMYEQLARMDEIIAYQLQRGRTSGHLTLARPTDVVPLLETLTRSLGKLRRDQPVDCEIRAEGDVAFFGDRGDFMEVAGNLLENAWKWSRGRVRVTLQPLGRDDTRRPGLRLVVEDDGPGIAEDQRKAVLRRGVRADEREPGHGLGLAMVTEIVAAYEGRVKIDGSELGGARVTVDFPPQSSLSMAGMEDGTDPE